MHIKKHLSFAALRAALSELFEQIEDSRQAGKVDYRLHDCLMSALAMMFFQDPSLLSFQRRMHDPLQCGNLKALFAVEAIPKDTALRESLDAVPTEALKPAFEIFLQRLQRGKQLAAYSVLDGHYLIALDGSQYFSSEQIQCPGCLTHQEAKGPLRYSHQILQAVMLHPHMRQVLPLAPEPVDELLCAQPAGLLHPPDTMGVRPQLPILPQQVQLPSGVLEQSARGYPDAVF